MKNKSDWLFLLALFSSVFFFFQKAFSIKFFLDDYFFIKIGQINSLTQFFNFFNPVRNYFYRPVPVELFYFILQLLHYHLFLAHLIVFVVYFIGLYFLYQSLCIITKRRLLAQMAVTLYALHFTHVFQLYQLATFIEICLFTFLSVSLYFFLQSRIKTSLFFFLIGLLSKETAILFPIFLLFFVAAYNWPQFRLKNFKNLRYYFLISLIFLFIYKMGVSGVATVDTYKLQLNPKLFINNLVWYFFWSVGLPNFMPDYSQNLLFKLLPDFWKLFNSSLALRIYLYGLIVYVAFLIASLVFVFYKKKSTAKETGLLAFFCLSSFFIFISPTLPIIHKWMVRLTLPLVFISLFQAYLLFKLAANGKHFKILAFLILAIFIFWNFWAIQIHESSSTYLLETRIAANLENILNSQREKIKRDDIKYIYFQDIKMPGAWKHSQKIKVSLNDQLFLDYYLPGKKIKALYGFESQKPKNNILTIIAASLYN